MRDELQHVLARGIGAAWHPDPPALLARLGSLRAAGDRRAGAGPRLRCTDPDDQKFIDLALADRRRAGC